MARLTLKDLAVDDVELPGGHVYTIGPKTRAVTAAEKDIDERGAKLDDDDFDGLVALYGELLNLRLKTTEPRQPQAGAVIGELWKADDIAITQIEQLIADVSRSGRPT